MTGYERYVTALDRHRRVVLLAIGLVVLLAGTSLLRLRLDLDLLTQLPARSPVFRDFRVLLERFAGRDELIAFVRGEPATVDRFVARFADRLREIPGIDRVQGGVDVERFQREVIRAERWRLLDERGYEEVAERLRPAAIEERVAGLRRALAAPLAAGLGRAIAADPLGIDEIVARRLAARYADPRLGGGDDDGALVVVQPETSAFDVPSAERLMAAVRDAENETRRAVADDDGGELEVGYTGGMIYALGDKRRLRGDLSIAFLLAPAAVFLAFTIGLRDARALPRVLASLVAVTALTFAVSLLLYDRLNMISIAFAGIFFGLGIDSGIYLLSALAARPAEEPRPRAVAAALASIGPANLVASLTSAAVFFLIGASQFTGVAQLGVLSGVAMLCNVGATFVLLPALLLAGSEPVRHAISGHASRRLAGLVAAAAKRRRAIVVGLLALGGLLLWPASRARLETDFTELRPRGGDAARVEAAIADSFGAFDVRGAMIVRAATLDRAAERTEDLVERLEELRRDGLVAGYTAFTSFFPSKATVVARERRFHDLPREDAAESLERALEARGFRLDPFRPFLRELREGPSVPASGRADPLEGPLAPIAAAHLDRGEGEAAEVAMATFVAPGPGHEFVDVADRLSAEIDDPEVVVTGRALAERELHRILSFELAAFLGGALLLNLALLVAAERSLARAGVLLSPTLIGLVATLALLGALDVPIDPVNLIVLPLLVGLGVDHGVYFAAHARGGGTLAEVVTRGLRPFAVVVVTTISAFVVLAFAGYPALAGLGRAGAIALGMAALGTLAALPLLVAAFHGELDSGDGTER